MKKVEEIRGEISKLQRKAQDTLDAANLKMTDLQSRIGASEGVSMVGTQFDGQIPPGETPAAAAAVGSRLRRWANPSATRMASVRSSAATVSCGERGKKRARSGRWLRPIRRR